ncbi:DUF4276 family protein [Roseomonas sp. GC11]|uniref:DUF4276 family protein n=1 Tax=Roseomonas sp. GC11 TaxID=2950546 RepID=UPI00210C54B9|nr:DUF4276 family protein [Roseomonas sp. GC11]MCQ4158807.1 DUF4276 family protein [Roseomonas sp. GC11]
MQLVFFVEEPSAEAELNALLPKLLAGRARWQIIDFGSKYGLLGKLEQRLRGYKKQIGQGEALRLVVMLDRDRDDCIALKARLEEVARRAGLTTKSRAAPDGAFTVLNRIVIEELESWFIGDADALRRAFPSLPQINARKPPFNNPDNGGSWETLHRFLKKHGIYGNSYPKIEAARKIAAHLTPAANRSRSFQVFRSGVEALLDPARR